MYIGGKFSPLLILIIGGWVLPNIIKYKKGIFRNGGHKISGKYGVMEYKVSQWSACCPFNNSVMCHLYVSFKFKVL